MCLRAALRSAYKGAVWPPDGGSDAHSFLFRRIPVDLFNYADELRYGQIHFKADQKSGLHAIVALHNLKRGPAIGGTRFIEYDNTELAIRDAMRLGRGMTYKAAISKLDHGGGKAVIIRPKGMTEAQRVEIFTAFGQFVDSLGGSYLTCEDSGTKVSDMNVVRKQTAHVLGFDPGAGSSGDPSPFTAFGVRRGIEAAVQFKLNRDSLKDLHVSIQGVGHVGYYLAQELHRAGARLTVTDVNKEAVDRCVAEFGATAVAPDAIYGVACDVFAPCALGAILNDATLPSSSARSSLAPPTTSSPRTATASPSRPLASSTPPTTPSTPAAS